MSQPNLLVIFSDQQHYQAAGFMDPWFDTPALDALAAESVVFEHAFCTTPQCSPSRSTVVTGLYPDKTGVMGNVGMAGGEPLRQATFGPALQAAGYRTGYFGKWHLGQQAIALTGWDQEMGVSVPALNDALVTELATEFLRETDDRPFALVLSYNDPHDVYNYRKTDSETDAAPLPPSFSTQAFDSVPAVQQEFMTDDQGRHIVNEPDRAWRHYRDVYRQKVRLYDQYVGRVMAALEASGQAENTAVIVFSDHGDMDTYHRLIFKGPFMYEHMIRVPLMIKLPGVPARRERDFHAVLTDIAPTLMELAGGQWPDCDGVSLVPVVLQDADAPRRDTVFGQYYSKQKWVNPIRMIRTPRWKYTLTTHYGEELYDLENDPEEQINLAAEPAYIQTLTDLSQKLSDWMAERQDPFPTQWPTTRQGEPIPKMG